MNCGWKRNEREVRYHARDRRAMLNRLFDMENRPDHMTENGDMLPELKKPVSREMFRGDIGFMYSNARKSNAGHRPYDAVL